MNLRRWSAVSLSLVAAVLLARPSLAQTFASGDLLISDPLSDAAACPRAAITDDGFVVAWSGRPFGQPARVSTFIRLFDRQGRAKTDAKQVTPLSLNVVGSPAVAIAADGSFVVASEVSPPIGPVHVVLQRFDALGRARGGVIRVEVDPSHLQVSPDLGVAPDGSFAMVWTRFPLTSAPPDAAIRFFDREGRPLGNARSLQAGPRFKSSPRIAASRDGRYAVVWTAGTQTSFATFGRLFNARGAALGPVARLANEEDRPTSQPNVVFSADGRQLAVSWTDPQIDPPPANSDEVDAVGVVAQIVTDRFVAVDPAIHLNQFMAGAQSRTAIAPRVDGSFLVAWESGANQDGSGTGVFGRLVERGVEPSEPERRFNQRALGNQSCPALAFAPSGRGVVVWHEERNGADRIVARLVAAR